MANEKIGSAYLEVVPKVSPNFGAEVKQQTSGIGESAGSELGEKFGGGFSGKMKTLIGIGAVAAGNILANMAQQALAVIGDVFSGAFNGFADFEQLSGGVEKIFDQANITQIMADAQAAYKDLNMSANEYLESINKVGASFAQTMGDQRGYDTARTGMKAIADYASGTGRSLDELNDKFSLITRSTSSYQSIADQFSGILPATSADFLEQAQAAGYLSDQYTALTQVPIDEYQQAVSLMLEKGVADMGLLGNTTAESAETISGSMAQAKAAWQNFLVAVADGGRSLDLSSAVDVLLESVGDMLANAIPTIGRIAASLVMKLPGIIIEALQGLPAMLQSAVTEAFGEDAGAMFAPITEAMENIVSVVQPIWETLQQVISGACEVIGSAIQTAWPFISEVIVTASEIIKGVVDAVWPAISAVIETAVNVIKGVIESLAPVVDFVTGIFNGVKAAMEDPINTAKSVIEGAINAIKGFFNFQIQWPHIPLPHFNVSGSINPIDWLTQGPPHFSIDWYAKGGFVDGATLIGAGEKGAEMILPQQGKLLEDFAQAISDKINGGGDTFVFKITADSETTLQSLVAQAQRARIAYGRA